MLIENAGLFPHLTARDNMLLKARVMGLTDMSQVDELLKLMKLDETGKKKTGQFSMGMKQRLGIAMALMGMNFMTGSYFKYNTLSDTLLYLLTLWLISNGFSALMILICVFTRSIAAGVVGATVFSSGLIVVLLDTVLRLFHANGIMNYTLYIKFTTAPQHFLTPGDYSGMAVGLIFTLLYIVISKIIISRQDF